MGETYADVVLRTNGHSIKKQVLVDTGSTFSWISDKALKEIGVKPSREEEFETIDGKIVKRKVGQLEMECLGRKSFTWVIFAGKKDSEVLGLHALEGLCLEVSPYNRQLKRAKSLKAYFSKLVEI